MGINPKMLALGLLGGLVAGLVSKKMLPRDQTDVDYRPVPQAGPHVLGGHESRPHVPGSANTQDRVI